MSKSIDKIKIALSAINLPNILTLIRILLAPLFVIFILKGLFIQSFIIFLVAAVSDGLDGFLARWLNQQTVLGSYLDPIADKLLLTSAYVSMAILEKVPAWLAVIVISRDVIISLGVMVLQFFSIRLQISPSIISKCTTFFQLSTILCLLLIPSFNGLSGLLAVLFWVTAILTVLSGFHYIYVGMNILQKATIDAQEFTPPDDKNM